MQKREYLDLTTEYGNRFYYRPESLKPMTYELEEYLDGISTMDDLHFAKKMLFSHELKANNQVEGYFDDLELIEEIIKKKTDNIQDDKTRGRILNLYRGYQFILRNRVMDDKHLKKLYEVLSNGLLDSYDLKHMGKNYREAPVYILQNGRLSGNLEEGVEYNKIPELIKKYFEFLNNYSFGDTKTDEYIKSQIMHFYLVYIHPYFDCNGRTSRTMSLWYLLKNKDYPYIIFNRGISFMGSIYDKTIHDAKLNYDLTYFLKLMLESVKIELEKEKIMQEYASATKYKFSGIDYQTILYILSMNNTLNVLNFASIYNRFNDVKRPDEIYREMLDPLINYHILEVVKMGKKSIKGISNMELALNKNIIPSSEEMHLKRVKF